MSAQPAIDRHLPAALRLPARHALRAFVDHHLLTYASAISFQMLTALPPSLLFGLALAGYLDLRWLWTDELGPPLQREISPAAWSVVDATVQDALGRQRAFWLTGGALLALWQVSGAVRAVMEALNLVYGAEEDRSWRRRIAVSVALAAVLGLAFGVAIVARLSTGPALADALDMDGAVTAAGEVLGWLLALAALCLAVAALVRWAPAVPQRVRWVSAGSAIVVLSWALMSAAFGWYASSVVDWASLFGGLAAIVVLAAYLYVSAIVFLLGAQVDALLRERSTGTRSGT